MSSLQWSSLNELNKLPRLSNLKSSFDASKDLFFAEFTCARVRRLTTLNHTRFSPKEKRDFELYYLKSFSDDYYESGGTEDPAQAQLTEAFVRKHPTYMEIVKDRGPPIDERQFKSHKSTKLKDIKLKLNVAFPENMVST